MLSQEQTDRVSYNGQCDTYAWLSQRAWVEINLSALSYNVKQLLKILSPRTQLMAVVKADAYGHGAVTVAQTVLESGRSEEHTSELQSRQYLVCRLLLEKKKTSE